jgi:FtsH-binding integral membrane protein
MQYAGLTLFVVAEAVIFVPLLYIAKEFAPEAIPAAAISTLVLFGVLTVVVFITRTDFSFLRSILLFGGFAAMGLIVVAILFNFNLGPIFVVAMIALACGYILYHTSNILHHYRIGQHVAASLALFASVALLFWYILQLFMSRD